MCETCPYAFFCPSLRVYHVYHTNVPMINNAPPITKTFMLLLACKVGPLVRLCAQFQNQLAAGNCITPRPL